MNGIEGEGVSTQVQEKAEKTKPELAWIRASFIDDAVFLFQFRLSVFKLSTNTFVESP
jgi:hypothetical protein